MATAENTWCQEDFKLSRDFLHAQQFGPFAQIPGIAYGDRALAAAPWNSLDGHAARGTIDTTHTVQENHHNAPKRNMDKLALRQPVIARTWRVTARTACLYSPCGARPWLQFLDLRPRLASASQTKPDTFLSIEYSLEGQLHDDRTRSCMGIADLAMSFDYAESKEETPTTSSSLPAIFRTSTNGQTIGWPLKKIWKSVVACWPFYPLRSTL